MALTKCSECGHAVSTEAENCANCGAPPSKFLQPKPKNSALGIVAGIILVAIGGLYALGSSSAGKADSSKEAAATAEPAAPIAPPPPAHHWTYQQDGEYGYEPAISADDQKAGTAVKPMIMVRYFGRTGDAQKWATVQGNITNVLTCTSPCDVVRSTIYANGQTLRQDTMRIAPGSVIGAIKEDTDNDQLKVYQRH